MKRLILFVSWVLLGGCAAQQQFIQTGSTQILSPKKASEVIIYSSVNQVPYAYLEIGELNYDKEPIHKTPKQQIDDLKRIASKQGAEGIVLHQGIGQHGYGSVINGTGFQTSKSFAYFSGTAIIRKPETVFVPIIQ